MKGIRCDYKFAQWCSSNISISNFYLTEDELIRQTINSVYVMNNNMYETINISYSNDSDIEMQKTRINKRLSFEDVGPFMWVDYTIFNINCYKHRLWRFSSHCFNLVCLF
jgi:hypothetical protein